jgi:NhaA family Na+:H+ antiporter
VSFDGETKWVFWGVTLGLMIGKPVGILAVSWLAACSGLAVLPLGVRWSQISVVGIVGGIGFTIALFVAQLAFPPGPLLETSKLAILCGSSLAGILSLVAGHQIMKPLQVPGNAKSEAEAEASTPR